ncbi:unnamed protein product [Merluccius merluccius]
MGQKLSEESDPDKEIDVAELQEWYKKFVVECPSGTLFMHEFKNFFGVTDNKEASDYIENMFRAFDKNGDNTIDFLEYVAALNLVLRGKLEHKLKWTFKMYDKDGSGCIDKGELLEIVECIYRLKRACHGELDEDCNTLTPNQVVDRIFDLVDVNQDGELSLDEFIDGARRDKWVMKMMQVEVNPKDWFRGERRALRHVTGDLFSCPEREALAHCISEDVRMGAGVAACFRKAFSGVEELRAQTCCRYDSRASELRASEPQSLRASDLCEGRLSETASPPAGHYIGCGLDRLKWERVSEMLEEVFKDSGVTVTVYSLPERTAAAK